MFITLEQSKSERWIRDTGSKIVTVLKTVDRRDLVQETDT